MWGEYTPLNREIMYLTARLIALSIYCAVLVGFCISLSKVRYTRFQLLLYALVLASMGYFYVPESGSDLSRIVLMLPGYARLSLPEILLTIKHIGTPVAVLYYHYVGMLNNSAHWLPAINAFITFSICFVILYRSSKKYELSNSLLALILFFFMSRGLLMMTIANIRTMLALSILGYCIYQEIIEEKSLFRYIPLLIIAPLIHTADMANLIIYLLFYLVYGFKSRKMFSNLLQSVCFIIIGSIGGMFYIQSAFLKGGNYIASRVEGTGFFYIWELIFSVLVLLFTLGLIITFLSSKKPSFVSKVATSRKLVYFLLYLTSLNILMFFFEFNIGYRTSWLVTILDMPLLAMLLSKNVFARRQFVLIKYAVFAFSSILLVCVCARGDLCSLKFF